MDNQQEQPLIGESPVFLEVLERVSRVAQLNRPVLVIGEGDGRLQVLTPAPVLIRAEDFGLAGGVEALRKVAGLESISTAVPVTVHLVFTHPD